MRDSRYFLVKPWTTHVRGFFTLVLFLWIVAYIATAPKTKLSAVIGLSGLQDRATALGMALYWKGKEVWKRTDQHERVIVYGLMKVISDDGQLSVLVPEESLYVERKYYLADVKIKNIRQVREFILANAMSSVKIEVFGDFAVVFLKDSVPLNIELIRSGNAVPIERPTTSLVNAAFAAYYWNFAFGAEEKSDFVLFIK